MSQSKQRSQDSTMLCEEMDNRPAPGSDGLWEFASLFPIVRHLHCHSDIFCAAFCFASGHMRWSGSASPHRNQSGVSCRKWSYLKISNKVTPNLLLSHVQIHAFQLQPLYISPPYLYWPSIGISHPLPLLAIFACIR